jgi:hypothetical protein
MRKFNNGLVSKDLILPKTNDYSAWAVIACDQFTSEIDYWNELSEEVKGKVSTLNLVLPEIYLGDNPQARIEKINQNIKSYIENGVFKTLSGGFILTVRKTQFVERRIGLVGAIDLEEYDFKVGSNTKVRATEGTITERIPPRLKVRKEAKAEFSHIMILFDDETKSINEKLYENRASYEKVYDFALNMGGGHIEGYFIPDTDKILDGFKALSDSERLIKKYGFLDEFIFAVGDGNHSLATAKTHWENVKKTLTEKERENHPARYAVCEFVNIYDEGIYFEPIHRFIKGVNVEDFTLKLQNANVGNITVFDGSKDIVLTKNNSLPDTIKALDAFIKDYIERFGGEIDYVHGEENVRNLVKTQNGVGVFLDKLDKSELFKYVSKNGALPRKTFSMGENIEKRYYLEGSIIAND